jgi:MtN3 and saliva related transmembrane protein
MPALLEIPANMVQYIGYFGSFLTAITFIPQVYKSWQSKSVGDLSILMVLIVVLSTIVWLVYGFAVNSGPVIVANFIVFALTLVLLYFKISFKKQG